MRYTPQETLQDAVDALEQHVAEHVPAGQPHVALGQVVSGLRRLAAVWNDVLPFLAKQNAELRALLGEPPAEPTLDAAAAFAENRRLNAALAARIAAGDADDAVRAFVTRWTAREAAVTGTDTSQMLPF